MENVRWESSLAGKCFKSRVRIRQRNEVVAGRVGNGRDLGPEVVEEGHRLERAPGFGRHHEDRAHRIDPVVNITDGTRMGAVEDDQLGVARRVAECGLVHLGCQARSPHAEQHHMVDVLPNLCGERFEIVKSRSHVVRKPEPSQPVGELRHLHLGPQGVVLRP